MIFIFIIHLEHAPDSIRGVLSLFCQEISTYLFISIASARTRDLLWEDIIKIDGIAAVLVYSDATESGYSIRKHGWPTYEIKDMDGLNLIMKPSNFQTKEIAEKLWAKSPTDKQKGQKKLLIDHMIETGVVAGCLLSGVYKPLLRQLSVLTEIEESALAKKIIFICAIHDIGKAHPIFQGRDTEIENTLKAIGLNQLTLGTKKIRHEKYVETIIKESYLLVCDANEENSNYIAQIISMHHQKEKQENNTKVAKIQDKNKNKRWSAIQKYLYHYMKEVFPFDDLNIIKQNNPHIFAIQNAILGILITSDWIASNEDVWKEQKSYKDFAEINDFLENRKKWVSLFLNAEHLKYLSIPAVPDFKTTFGFTGRPVQKDVEDIVHHNDVKVMLVESGCGSGKTEAALYAAAVLGHRYGLSGMYMGLPTGVSAAALQGRVEDFLCNKIKVDEITKTKLLTSQAIFLKESEEDGSGDNLKSEWTDLSRQRLLYPYSIGTVDQVMTVARLVRFESLRMAGLSSKVLIIDEIHAYDIYMMAIIEKLIQICGELGVPVILLSATLPVTTKKNLFAIATGNNEITVHDGYPMISYVTKDNIFHEKVSESYEKEKEIECEVLPILYNPECIAQNAIDAISNGGCLCIIMNTVKDAISVYDEAKKQSGDGCEILLYHARMPMSTRDKKSKRILKLFGKEWSNRPQRAIVIGTQVLEQSLDVDFDYMMTAICPIDLLLQRIGRYHRHEDVGTIREQKTLQNKIQVLIPKSEESYGRPYDSYYLDATIDLLRKRRQLMVPSCTPEVINTVYDYNKITADIQVENNLKAAQSDEGNLAIEKGFEIYTKRANISDTNLNVRLKTDTQEQVAILSSQEINMLGKNTKNDIELFKNRVVSVYANQVEDFESAIDVSGIFKNVKIYSENTCISTKGDKIMTIDEEYGLRILDA